ncbi:TetR/AcrR family transcriptional regulator C-terminal domain-containing protein [Herbiconiux moechotypicola]|uniref:TetR/AcrR family transcriptional regulator C-terminal domain-containing protein n=1 Tax=Herbiconiux moechotypicola TaxID=637393 RepID=A0ABP5QFH5_9MICO|nr:TetR/AcrR family transcriptional regulator C-terminal domain-containing protein [Herbiconiux moechotypicola]MCS5729992.1 TetR/AcrR family transcriptional regulator C-terminal domain-containing protein [Herbiconiux moechotypicola]
MAPRITKAAIVDAALAVLDDGGASAVTVRAVAARLDVQAPALYYHVGSKQHLLDEMGTEILRRVVATLAEREADVDRVASGGGVGGWLGDLAAYARALRDEYLVHRDGARTFSGTLVTDRAVLTAQEPWLRRWVASGVSAEAAFDALDVVTAFVTGSVIEEQERRRSADDPARYEPGRRELRLGQESPLVVEAGYARADSDHDGRFERQLAVVLSGVDRSSDGAVGRVAP